MEPAHPAATNNQPPPARDFGKIFLVRFISSFFFGSVEYVRVFGVVVGLPRRQSDRPVRMLEVLSRDRAVLVVIIMLRLGKTAENGSSVTGRGDQNGTQGFDSLTQDLTPRQDADWPRQPIPFPGGSRGEYRDLACLVGCFHRFLLPRSVAVSCHQRWSGPNDTLRSAARKKSRQSLSCLSFCRQEVTTRRPSFSSFLWRVVQLNCCP